ncbi:hypothetical protein V6Z11_A11G102400, partial [Gossypium hirsutum]
RTGVIVLLSLMVILEVFAPWSGMSQSMFSNSRKVSSLSEWRDYSMAEAASFVNKNGTINVCTVSQPYLPFLNNWLISITRQKYQEKVLVIVEDYATLYKVNKKWPGHAVLGFFNFTSRRLRHLLQILELGYSVMYNDVDMVWFGDPFCYLEGNHDVTSLMTWLRCVIFLRPTDGAKLVMKKWTEELQAQPWSKAKKVNDQPAFNWALNKTAGLQTKGRHVIIHDNYITGFEKKIKPESMGYGWSMIMPSSPPLGRL